MQDGSLIRRSGAYSAALPVLSRLEAEHDGNSIATIFAHADGLLSPLATFAAKRWPCANAVRLPPRCSQGLFRMRAGALGRQGSIIIVVVRFHGDTAAWSLLVERGNMTSRVR